MSSKLSASQYLTALGFLRDQVNSLEPAQLVQPVEGLTSLEGDRIAVVRAVTSLKALVENAYAAAMRGQS
ncbi:MAG: hypothetical protein U0X20_27550 [Caldilineaceae bacterium]